jgi:predicted aspartyl protease
MNRRMTVALVATLLLQVSMPGVAADSVVPAAVPAQEELAEVIISVPEARYVSPTRRDRIGRIWAPVMINGQGPFRLVLDTGATHSAVIADVAARLGLPLDVEPPIKLRGVTGTAIVPVVKADSLVVGDLVLGGSRLPIVIDALGGAEGVLGTEGLADMRIRIDFRGDEITIARSHNQPAPAGFITLPVRFSANRLPLIDATIGGVRSTAIIDTGGQASIGNNALRDAILRRRIKQQPTIDEITGATADVQRGEGYPAPIIEMGNLQVQGSHVTFGDMQIFEHWRLTDEPAMMIGMDTLGLLDTLIIDYKRNELQVRLTDKALRRQRR